MSKVRMAKRETDPWYILDGVGKRIGGWLRCRGWTWIRGVGGPGVWATRSRFEAEFAAQELGIQIEYVQGAAR
jgi:hypothetical protein